MEDDDEDTATTDAWGCELFMSHWLFANEMSKAEAVNKLLNRHMSPEILDWSFDRTSWKFHLSHCKVDVIIENFKPSHVVVFSDSMHRKFLDPMRVELRRILRESSQHCRDCLEVAIVLLQVVEEGVVWQEAWKDTLTSTTTAWTAKSVQDWTSVLDNPYGVDLVSITDTALDVLTVPISKICANVSKDLRILHVEPVYRNDLVARFLSERLRILEHVREMPISELRKSVPSSVIRSPNASIEELAQQLAEPTVTYHGAPRHVLESIVRYGFIVPGHEIGDTGRIQVGSSTYGSGIYCSPDPMYASTYAGYYNGKPGATRPSDVPGMRLVVCATLMGRPLSVSSKQARGCLQPLDNSAHSHIASHRPEYILFNSAQIIPCFVLHLDYGAEKTKAEFDKILADPERYFLRRQQGLFINKWVDPVLCPGDVQRKKQALKDAAAKWFAYGYGPAKNSNFVIEDIADVSDDEEVYGDFQNQRIEHESEIRNQDLGHRRSWFDEYQTVRKTKRQVRVGPSLEN